MPKVCILFHKIPEGTHFIKGSYSLVDEAEAGMYISEGYGVVYDPVEKKPVVPEAENSRGPATNEGEGMPEGGNTFLLPIPEDFPGREQLIAAGFDTMDKVKGVLEFDQITGIGQATQKRIIDYLNEYI